MEWDTNLAARDETMENGQEGGDSNLGCHIPSMRAILPASKPGSTLMVQLAA